MRKVTLTLDHQLAVLLSLLLNVVNIDLIEVLALPAAYHVCPFLDRVPELLAVLVLLARLLDVVESADLPHIESFLVVLNLSLLAVEPGDLEVVCIDCANHLNKVLLDVQVLL